MHPDLALVLYHQQERELEATLRRGLLRTCCAALGAVRRSWRRQDAATGATPSSSSNVSTRSRIASRTGRTLSIGCPAGSSSTQSS